jgi:hypothetical protein
MHVRCWQGLQRERDRAGDLQVGVLGPGRQSLPINQLSVVSYWASISVHNSIAMFFPKNKQIPWRDSNPGLLILWWFFTRKKRDCVLRQHFGLATQ